MMPYKVVRFRIGGKDSGASQYERQIDNALGRESDEYSYIVKDIESYKFLPRFLALILFWLRAQCMLLFGRVDIVIVSPDIMLIYPTYVSIICISHHYDPSVIKGIRLIYVKISNWLFICYCKIKLGIKVRDNPSFSDTPIVSSLSYGVYIFDSKSSPMAHA